MENEKLQSFKEALTVFVEDEKRVDILFNSTLDFLLHGIEEQTPAISDALEQLFNKKFHTSDKEAFALGIIFYWIIETTNAAIIVHSKKFIDPHAN